MIQALKEREAFQRFSTINDVIDASIGKRLPVEELLYLYVMILCRRSLTDLAGEQQFIQELQPNVGITDCAQLFLSAFGQQSNDLQRHDPCAFFFTMLYLKNSYHQSQIKIFLIFMKSSKRNTQICILSY